MERIASTLALVAFSIAAFGQINDKGVFHASLGVDLGLHATQYKQTLRILGVPISESKSDAAATVLAPIHLQYGISPLVSLGLYAEPGRYLDSSATRSNGMALVGIQPRFHIVNRDNFTWMGTLQLGGTVLRIEDSDALGTFSSTYRGPHFGLGTGVGFYFSELIGFQLHLRYLATSFALSEYERNGTSLSNDVFDASLNTGGITLQAALALRL